jgi:hypothetical protein
MRRHPIFAWLLLALTQSATAGELDLAAHAKDLAISIRPHADMLVFGDPLFVEVTVVNRGKETIRAPAPGLLEFIVKERDSDLQLTCPGGGWPPGLAGDTPIHAYAPNQPVTLIHFIGLPGNIKDVPKNIDDLGHPFWRRVVGGASLGIRCVFHFDQSGLQIASNEALISIKPRPQKEIAALQEFAEYDKRSGDTDILLGIIVLDGLRWRAQTKLLEASVQSGELAGGLKLTRLMEQLKYDRDLDREAMSQQVLDWVIAQPDIKRQSMAQHLSDTRYHLILSTGALEEIRKIAKQPVAPPE